MEPSPPLIALLTQHTERPFVPECLNALGDDRWQYDETGATAPIKQIRDIYRVRAAINHRRGSPITGFDELLAQLNALEDTAVRIHALDFADAWYMVFTDTSVETLLGILAKPAGVTLEKLTSRVAVAA